MCTVAGLPQANRLIQVTSSARSYVAFGKEPCGTFDQSCSKHTDGLKRKKKEEVKSLEKEPNNGAIGSNDVTLDKDRG